MEEQWTAFVEENTLPLLKWAWSKCGQWDRAEELAQEVWLQFFTTLRRESQVLLPEHLLWRIAKFVWCKSLRSKTPGDIPFDPSEDEPDFAEELALQEERAQLSAWLHQRITQLSRTQREIMILYYIDQLPQQTIAARLNTTVAAVRWHLFDTRRKLREEHHTMEQKEYIYRPSTLEIGINGQAVPNMATNTAASNLLMQNILLYCYRQGHTVPEISAGLGVAAAYVEHDLQWLKEQELVTEDKGRYFTAFTIHDKQFESDIIGVFMKNQEQVSLRIVHRLLEKENAIRSLGFIGCDKPMNKLLWLLIYHFTRHLPLPVENPNPPFRPDGGRYWPLGFSRSQPIENDLRGNWAYNGAMNNDGFYWFGLYDFGHSDIEHLMDAWTPEWLNLRKLLEKLITNGFDLSCVTEDERFNLATLAEKGFIIMEGSKAMPNFVIFTREQYEKLCAEVFQPLADELQPALQTIAEDLRRMSAAALPAHLQHLSQHDVAQAMHDIGFATELLAFQAGYLYKPESKRDGEFLTCCYVQR